MEIKVKATKARLYKLAKDFSNVPMAPIENTNFSKISSSKAYVMEAGEYTFYLFECVGKITLGVKDKERNVKIIDISIEDAKERGLLN